MRNGAKMQEIKLTKNNEGEKDYGKNEMPEMREKVWL